MGLTQEKFIEDVRLSSGLKEGNMASPSSVEVEP